MNATQAWVEAQRRAKAEGLFDSQPWYYTKLGLWVLFLFFTPIAWVLIAPSWWCVFFGAPLWALGFSQVGLLGHDVTHVQLLRKRWVNTTAGIVLGNFFIGLSRRWWRERHEAHHDDPNDIDLDPDIDLLFFIFDPRQIEKKPKWLRPVIKKQGIVFFFVLPLQAVRMYYEGLKYLVTTRGQLWKLETAVMLLHLLVYCGLLFSQLSITQALCFVMIHRGLFGVLNGVLFANNHKGEETVTVDENLAALAKQVVTARDTVIPKGMGWVFGGLQYQIAHHVYRSMPRNNLPRAQEILEELCAEVGLEYSKASLIESYRISFGHLFSVPGRVEAMA